MTTTHVFKTKEALYQEGLRLARKFLKVNRIPEPAFYTYEEALAGAQSLIETYPFRLLHKVANGPLVGTKTGLYTDSHIFVNVPVTAWPVQKPQARSWSWPGWKTDRTAIGVVAHELGHYLEHYFQIMGQLSIEECRGSWMDIIENHNKQYRSRKKQVSGYEPVPSEAWAESCRLFILNPDLLQRGLPERYNFIRKFVRPSEGRQWFEVLGNSNYYKPAERWMNA